MDRSEQNEREINGGGNSASDGKKDLVRLVKSSGSIIDVVNAARVSFGKEIKHIENKDRQLIRYLWKNHHTSPFRHIHFTFHIKAPIFVLRQWMKHQVGCSWNEISGRYVQFEPKFFCPDQWRTKPDKYVKQGSGQPFYDDENEIISRQYKLLVEKCYELYNEFIELGVCKEQARIILPLSLVSECYWTCSFQAVLHFLNQRLDSHSQVEIREYALKVKSLLMDLDGVGEMIKIIDEI
tara:strand:- start:152 stop:865 length:714 start_codon:yes stop_codon:yes gene_type:complete